jgi:hypothetical protein
MHVIVQVPGATRVINKETDEIVEEYPLEPWETHSSNRGKIKAIDLVGRLDHKDKLYYDFTRVIIDRTREPAVAV